jgi:hypothetical protein
VSQGLGSARRGIAMRLFLEKGHAGDLVALELALVLEEAFEVLAVVPSTGRERAGLEPNLTWPRGRRQARHVIRGWVGGRINGRSRDAGRRRATSFRVQRGGAANPRS